MDNLLKYEFAKYLGVLIILSAPLPFLKNDILKDYSVIEQIIITNLIISVIFILIYVFYEKKDISNLLKTNKSTKKIIVFSLIVTTTLLIGGKILQTEGKVVRYKSFERALTTLFMLLFGLGFSSEKITIKTCIGVLILTFGLFLIEK